MITMLLGGLWHGASWNFVLWGGLHGFYLALHKLYKRGKRVEGPFKYTNLISLIKYLFSMILTNILVLITWLFFRARDLSTVKLFFIKMINWEQSDLALRFLVITLSFMSMSLLIDCLEYYTKTHTFLLLIPSKSVIAGILTGMLFVTLAFMFQSEPLPFVYFQF
jgi:alginate O-acetyltransferase complex protein AlgI